jgi:hypothetical protein
MTENYDVEYFIDHYLKTHKYTLSDENRNIVAAALEDFPGTAPSSVTISPCFWMQSSRSGGSGTLFINDER